MNLAFPGSVRDDRFLYNYESNNPNPFAIDQFGRYLSPVLARHIATPGSFGTSYLRESLALTMTFLINI